MRKPKVKARYFYECGGCDHYHPLGWTGDCRDDSQRFTDEDLPGGARLMDEDAPLPPDDVQPRQGVEVGCGDFTCTDCYEPWQPEVKP